MNRDETLHPSHGLYTYENYGANHSSSVLEKTHYQPPTTHTVNAFSKVPLNGNGWLGDEMGLSSSFARMNIRDESEGSGKMKHFGWNPDGFGSGKRPVLDVQPNGPYEGFSSNFSEKRGWQYASNGAPISFNSDKDSGFVGGRGSYDCGHSVGNSLAQNRANALYSGPSFHKNQMNDAMERREGLGRSSDLWEAQLQNSSVARPYLNDGFVLPKEHGMAFNGGMDAIGPLDFTLPFGCKVARTVETTSYHNGSMLNGKSLPQSLLPGQCYGEIPASAYGSDFLTQREKANHVGGNRWISLTNSNMYSMYSSNGINRKSLEEDGFNLDRHTHTGEIRGNCGRLDNCSVSVSPKHICRLDDFRGHIYFMAKDQNGCRLLQRMFDEGNSESVKIIFNEVIHHIVELMMNPFGNYLVQKLLDVCSEEQRMKVLLKVTEEPGQLVKISSSAHGTRVVQKLIQTVKTRRQISLLKSALEPGFLELIKDLHGNHVVQRCLHGFSNEDNKFIFDAATKFCVDIATHRHGCCVLQRCIEHSAGEYREKLVIKISTNGLLLAQDPFGNYAVQYIIELKNPSATAILNSQFGGNYVYLSMQKCSSHVVEKCLRFLEDFRPIIIHELLSVPRFGDLLDDPYANYVVRTALEISQDHLRESLAEAIRPYKNLRTSPYCKRIFSTLEHLKK